MPFYFLLIYRKWLIFAIYAKSFWVFREKLHLDTCIAIRMAVKQAGKVTVQAGGGIVADSVPELEYEESANKAKAVIQAILQAGEVDDR